MDLYIYVPPLGVNIPISVEPFPVEESVPTEDVIEWAVKRLQNHHSRGTYGMRAKHLKGWITAARNKKKEETADKQDKPTEERNMPGPDRAGRDDSIFSPYFSWMIYLSIYHPRNVR